jgi:hypothetical protein
MMEKRVRMVIKGLPVFLVAVLWMWGSAGVVQASEGTAAEGGIVRHEVEKGDNLMLLAGYYYKDPRQWKKIYALNSGTISNPNVILPGTVLKVKAEPSLQWNIPYAEFLSRVFD